MARLDPKVIPSSVISGLISLVNGSAKSNPLSVRAAIFALARLLQAPTNGGKDSGRLLPVRRVAFDVIKKVGDPLVYG